MPPPADTSNSTGIDENDWGKLKTSNKIDLLADLKLDTHPQAPPKLQQTQTASNPNIWGTATAGAAVNNNSDWFGGSQSQQPTAPSHAAVNKKEEFLDLLG